MSPLAPTAANQTTVGTDAPVAEPSDNTNCPRTVRQLWDAYKANPTALGREELILHYAPLVTMIAGRVGMKLPNTVEAADLVSYGMFGLIDAIDKFDPSRDIKFETYASTRVRGAIIDELRALDWIPRSVRSRAREYDRACEHLENTLHREPTSGEIAQHLGVPEKTYGNFSGKCPRGTLLRSMKWYPLVTVWIKSLPWTVFRKHLQSILLNRLRKEKCAKFLHRLSTTSMNANVPW